MAPSRAPVPRQKFYFQFVTTPTVDTPGTTLLLHFDNRRYFFGSLAEGTQRACVERGVSLRKIRNIFLTGSTRWEQMGGLIGMLLTVADIPNEDREVVIKDGVSQEQRPRLHIHGGPKLLHAIACARRFVFRTAMPLSIHEAKKHKSVGIEPNYQDENINVWTVPVLRGRSGIASPVMRNGRSGSPTTVDREQTLREKTVTDMFDSDWRKDRLLEYRFDQVKLPAIIWTRDPETKALQHVRCATMDDAPHLTPESIVMVRNPWPAAMVEELPSADNLPGTMSIGYVVCGQPQRGKFHPQKADAIGVKPGPDRGKLIAGKSITLKDGTVVTPEMVMGDTEPGLGMAIFDIPSVDYLDNLTEQIDVMRDNKVLDGVKAVSWLLGPGVYTSSAYQDLVRSLPGLQHMVSSPDVNSNYVAFDSSAAATFRLSQIRPGCFQPPVHSNEVTTQAEQVVELTSLPITIAQRGLTLQLTPKTSIETAEVPAPFNADQAQITSEAVDLLPTSKQDEVTTKYGDIEILTLGTGSAVPSKYRNVSATLVRIPGNGSYLFDCGEGTLGQLRRTHSPEELDAVLCDLKMIWISHLHADHHLGIMSVITARHQAVQRNLSSHDGVTLHIVSEPNMADYLSDFSSIQPSYGCTLLSVRNSRLQKHNGAAVTAESLPLNIEELKTCLVDHCHGAQAISVTFANGFKFSYSGDCRPSATFAKIGQDSHVLLHEATFDDGMEGDAMAKKHCTTGEAVGVATAMRAKNLLLTHFSQRYQKIPVLTNIKVVDSADDVGGDEPDFEGDMEPPNLDVTAVEDTAPTVKRDQMGREGQNSRLLEAAATSDLNICVAFDMMRIKCSQIPSMHLYYPAIERMLEVEQTKSDSVREELAKLNNDQQSAKKKKQAPAIVSETQSSKKSNGSIYERINRAKSSKSAQIQKEKLEGEAATDSETGQQQQQPQTLSKRAQKRKKAAEEKKQFQNQHQNMKQDQQEEEEEEVQKGETKKPKLSTPDMEGM